jgi:NAD(P)-dependent dehydrogenase (short-subunit alcohol dehydrogenase family)
MQDNNKVAVITGASRGLGRTLVEEFSKNGWTVIGTGRSQQPEDFPDNATYQQFDAGNFEACTSFWEKIKASYPNARFCLVNNAGSYTAANGGLSEANPEDFANQMQSVYFTSVYMTQGLVRTISAARIINIVSSSALLHEPSELAYGSAKDAQRHFFQTLQESYKPEQYQITNLYPDYIATHGPNPDAMNAADLAAFVHEQADSRATYYLRDVTVYPVKRHAQ